METSDTPLLTSRGLWIDAVMGERVGHAVVIRNGLVFHDPAERAGGLSLESLREFMFSITFVAANARERDRWGAPVR
jgi:hypothetical protein